MTEPGAIRAQLGRQVVHWSHAVDGLQDLGLIASPASWEALGRSVGASLRASLTDAVDHLRRWATVLQAQHAAAETPAEISRLQQDLVGFRRRYLQTETVLDFYGDAVNTRTTPALGTTLRACDALATAAMRSVLRPLDRPVPPVLTYLDKGLGASILGAGMPLWDGRSVSRVAAIKIARHNLNWPTSLTHEAGHQVARVVGWVDELRGVLLRALDAAPRLAAMWSGWTSEIVADAFAFVTTGYASLAALHDVIAGDPSYVLRLDPLDPHPAGWLRVWLGHTMCRRCFGAGPWDEMLASWCASYPLERADPQAAEAFQASVPWMPTLCAAILESPLRALGDRSLVHHVSPDRVRPDALFALERSAGPALYRSSDWVRRESLRLLALSGYRAAVDPHSDALVTQREWMRTLGDLEAA